MEDIKVNFKECEFYCRSCGLIEQDGKFLIMKSEKADYFHIPGGHIEVFEDSEKAVCREIKEEVGCEVLPKKLFCINENFYVKRGKNFHGIEFYYLLGLKEKIHIKDCEKTEKDKGVLKKFQLKWVEINQMKDIDLRPLTVKNLIINNQLSFTHLIKKNLE